MDDILDTQVPDEARPTKRVRLEAPLEVTEQVRDEMADEENWDDVYGESGDKTAPSSTVVENAISQPSEDAASTSQESTFAPALPTQHEQQETQPSKEEMKDGIPAEAISSGDNLVSPPTEEGATASVLAETTEIVCEVPESNEQPMAMDAEHQQQLEPPTTADGRTDDKLPTDMVMVDAEASNTQSKPADYSEFMAAAAAQKGEKGAEWQFDSSDAESSSDSSSSDSDSDSDNDSEEGYEMLDPAALAKILMSGDGDDEDGGKSKGGKSAAEHQPRTTNEVKEVKVEKPDVKVTPEMKITFLGIVERTVENMALIKGATPGEYQVLEGGSVLCTEDRVVIGAVADTFGRVQEPLYSVAFTNAKEIEEAGLTHGTKLYYVDSHSTFVFTQPLRNMKGTDASNIHDEEVNEDEAEFSDDEAEAEYKRQKKLAKKAGRGGAARGGGGGGARSFGAPGHDSGDTFIGGSDAPSQSYGGGMSYDDDEPAEFYQPLKRPDNLAELMSGGAPAPRPQPALDRGRGGRGRGGDGGRGRGDRGRGRGDRGRGRGDRGRGRGGPDQGGQRGGRGGADQAAGFKHNAHTYPDQHNSQPAAPRAHALPEKPVVPQGALENGFQPPQYPPQQAPQTYQFNGYQFQYSNPQAPQHPPGGAQFNPYAQQQLQPPNPTNPPPGAYVNPAFFQQQQYAQPPQQAYAPWTGQQTQQQYPPPHAQQHTSSGQAPPLPPGDTPDLAGILRQLGQQPRQ